MRHFWLALIAWYFPLCATFGTSGIAAPGVVDFSHFARARYSTYLVAPAGFATTPDMVAPVFECPAAALFADIQAVAARPRIFPLDVEPGALQAAWVARTAISNFPDVIEVAVLPRGAEKSTLIFYSHSLYGWNAYGVNHRRGVAWLQELQMKEAGSCAVR